MIRAHEIDLDAGGGERLWIRKQEAIHSSELLRNWDKFEVRLHTFSYSVLQLMSSIISLHGLCNLCCSQLYCTEDDTPIFALIMHV